MLVKMNHKVKSKILNPELSEVNQYIFSDFNIASSIPCFQPKGGFLKNNIFSNDAFFVTRNGG